MRQSELAEGRIKHRPDMVGVRAAQRLAAQKIAAMGVGNRQRFTPLAVTGQKPTLEVDAPDVVGGFTMGKGALDGGPRPRNLRFNVSPSRSDSSPIGPPPCPFGLGPRRSR